jgi:pyruvate dehydrogenase E2 component (dihydrolipoamide acetyltransferase)
METGTIAKWHLTAGDTFGAGDVLCEIETDKATMDFEAQDDGRIAKILKDGADATDLNVGVPICVVVEEDDDIAAFADYVAEGAATEETNEEVDAPAATPSASAPAAAPAQEITVSMEHILMPSARHLSQSKGVDATGLPGTGKGGRITKGDVLEAFKNGVDLPPLSVASTTVADVAAPAAATATAIPTSAAASISNAPVTIPTIHPSGTFTDTPNNNMRKVIAKRLTESKSTVPHFYASAEIELDNIMSLRKKLKEDMDVKVSVNDLIIRASALALRDVPEVNASFQPKTEKVTMSPTVDISVAVATPGGLITPIVPNTDQMGLSEISAKVRDLATRARDGKLAPEEYQGGSFCISNLGMFGINEFSAVINPPQAAILAVGGGVKKVVVNTAYDETKSLEEQEKPTVRNVMTARLSADRRVVDEPTVGLYLSALKYYLNKPELLVL